MKRSLFVLVVMAVLSSVAFAQTAPPASVSKFKIGDMAPDFTLTDTAGVKVTLSEFRGKNNVVLAFYVFAFTGG